MIGSDLQELHRRGELTGASGKRLIFIAGAEGSGTTLLRRLVAAPDGCASFGRDIAKNLDHPEAMALFTGFEAVSRRLWDRLLTLPEHEQARQEWHRIAALMAASSGFAAATHFVMKRSFPFGPTQERACPDLWDVLALPIEARIVTIYRDPCAATYSALRRSFDTDLHRLAVRCANHLIFLAGQMRAIDPARRRIISYPALCAAPAAVLEPLAEFCGLPAAPMLEAASAEGILGDTDRRYASELAPSDVAWLEGYFSPDRRRQWEILERSR